MGFQEHSNKALPSPRSESEGDNGSTTCVSLDDSRSEMSYITSNSIENDSTNGSMHNSVEGDSAFSIAGTEDENTVDELILTRTAVMSKGAAAVMTQVKNKLS